MLELPYDQLNDLVHEIGDAIERAVPGTSPLDRVELNDLLSSYLASKNVSFTDET